MIKRQEKILNVIVKEYVKNSKPVSSKSLINKLGLSSATIRNEMKELEKDGCLQKPHTSGGRIPTEKGYRFFIKFLEGGKIKVPVNKQSSEDIFEKHFNYLFEQVGKEETKVFIGKEIPLAEIRKFTLIITSYKVSNRKQEVIGLLGPTRMRYDYNISLINKLREMMENYE